LRRICSDGGDDQEDEERIKIEEMKVAGYDCPIFHLSEKEESRIQRPWKRGIIVKMLGRKIGYKALENRLKPLLAMFSIKDRTYKVEYEGLHLLCKGCGKFGHYVEGCPTKTIVAASNGGINGNLNKEDGRSDNANAQSTGPWTVVTKPRRPKRAAKNTEDKTEAENATGSRFPILGTNHEDNESDKIPEKQQLYNEGDLST
jgi:hypothetical protein